MKFGILLNHQFLRTDSLAARLGETVELVTAASELGLDSVFGIHHYLARLKLPSP